MRLIRGRRAGPALEALTYPFPTSSPSGVGARVLVPLGTRIVTGRAVEPGIRDADRIRRPDRRTRTRPDPDRIKEIIDVLDDEPFLPADVVALASWVADYYACGVGEAIAAAMPPRAWIESERYAQITDAGARAAAASSAASRRDGARAADRRRSRVRVDVDCVGEGAACTPRCVALERDGLVDADAAAEGAGVRLPHRARRDADRAGTRHRRPTSDSGPPAAAASSAKRRAAQALDVSATRSTSCTASRRHRSASSARRHPRATLTRLAGLGLITFYAATRRARSVRAWRAAAIEPAPVVVLTDEQAAALDRLATLAQTRTFPAGAAARRHRQRQDRALSAPGRARARAAGRGVLLLVPEIALTPAVAAAFRARVRRPRRHPAQRPVRRRAPRPVAAHPPRRRRRRRRHALGGVRAARERSASSSWTRSTTAPYKQEESPRYHGRDVAVMRGAARRRAGRARLGDAVARELPQRAERPLRAARRSSRRVLDRPLADGRGSSTCARSTRRRART